MGWPGPSSLVPPERLLGQHGMPSSSGVMDPRAMPAAALTAVGVVKTTVYGPFNQGTSVHPYLVPWYKLRHLLPKGVSILSCTNLVT